MQRSQTFSAEGSARDCCSEAEPPGSRPPIRRSGIAPISAEAPTTIITVRLLPSAISTAIGSAIWFPAFRTTTPTATMPATPTSSTASSVPKPTADRFPHPLTTRNFGRRAAADCCNHRAELISATGLIFLANNRIQPGVATTADGLQYKVITQGTGPRPTQSDKVIVNYKGTLTEWRRIRSGQRRRILAHWSCARFCRGAQADARWLPLDGLYTDRIWPTVHRPPPGIHHRGK